VLSGLPVSHDERVLVDYRTHDDGGVYSLDEKTTLVQTVDFFTPIVDDPYQYGQIAAANALSDIYAMGGRPLTALAIAAFPDGLEPAIVRAIFEGGIDKLREAGVVLLGGHTVRDTEIKFGYAVTGSIDRRRVWTNTGARPGDVLVVTKPIGTGIVSTAIKFERAPDAIRDAAVSSMRTLNREVAEILSREPTGIVHACTDVTGFGLIGHACEVAEASGVAIELESARVPVLDGARELALANRAGGNRTNETYFGPRVAFGPRGDAVLEALLYDPQTSGGLLVALGPAAASGVMDALCRASVPAAQIGRVLAPGPTLVIVN
jgi:selenide, water dikinase